MKSKGREDLQRFEIINHMESMILKLCRIHHLCYYARGLEGNDIQRLILKGSTVFKGISAF